MDVITHSTRTHIEDQPRELMNVLRHGRTRPPSRTMRCTDRLDAIDPDNWRTHIKYWNEIRVQAQENRARPAKRQERNFNKAAKPQTSYQSGDLVLLFKDPKGKLDVPWVGPFSVLKDNDNNTVTILYSNGKPRTYNKSRLSPYTDRTISLTEITRPGWEEMKEHEERAINPGKRGRKRARAQGGEHEIRRITEHRVHEGQEQYRVEREGYARPIWVKASQLASSPAADEFHRLAMLRGEHHHDQGDEQAAKRRRTSEPDDDQPDEEPEPVRETIVAEEPAAETSATMTSTTTTTSTVPQSTTTEDSQDMTVPSASNRSRRGRLIRAPTKFE